jgi:hypothetical protein
MLRKRSVMKLKLLEGTYKELHQVINNKKDDYFEFELSFLDENISFKEIDRFLYESRTQKTYFKNQYEGKVYINLSQWNEMQNKYLDAFLYFLYDNVEDNILQVVFIIEEKISDNLMKRLEKIFDVECVTLRELRKEPNDRVIGFVADRHRLIQRKGESSDEQICE